ncbi:3967_t:CDS:2 [Ambispora leptoticha]|uniref:3967_t:CDS:1 n=1 Tax=Ambispora leptoticha TaxID=144679 RepID=A0A9N9DL43_9GLOM|nr:3967_t:CDS:2 [Ambispora leptoticha]
MDVDVDNESAVIPPADIVKSFSRYQTEAFRDLLYASENSLRIDASEISFLRSVDRSAAKSLDATGDKILSLINRLVANSGLLSATTTNRSGDPLLGSAEDIENKFSDIVEVIDSALEKADVCLDEYTGRAKQIAVPITASTPIVAQLSTNADTRILYAKNILRPQLRFPDTIDNSRTPFVPKIKEKPNAIVPLQTFADGNRMAIEDDDASGFPHPYEYEINNLEYPEHMFKVPNNDDGQYMPGPMDTAHIFITKEEELTALCDKLNTVQEIAIDLEHHDYRSFQGFTCLIQISTRDQDYILDAFTLRHAMHALNHPFTNPNIVKVFHGANSDIQWLQKDFGVYVVNLFDTFHASNVLALPQHSYAFLVKNYCGIEIDKRFQLADWRMRPLPIEMLNYARTDTHYLLYIYDRMRKELLQKSPNLLQVTLDRSREVSLLKYEKDRSDPETGEGNGGWKNDLSKCNRHFNNQQLAVFKVLHAWRDTRAREEDESVRYVLPNNMLFELAQRMPIETSGVISCCNPTPTLVRMHAIDLALLIERTKKEAEISSNKPMETTKTLYNNASEIVPVEKSLGDITTQIVNEFELCENDAARLLAKTSKLFGKELDEITEIDPKSFQIVMRLLESMEVFASIPKILNIEQYQIQQQPPHLFVPAELRKTKGKEREVVDNSSINNNVTLHDQEEDIDQNPNQRKPKFSKGKEREVNIFSSSNNIHSKEVIEIMDDDEVSIPMDLENNEHIAEIKNESDLRKPTLMQKGDNYIYTGESIRQMTSKKRGRGGKNKGKKKESNEGLAESSSRNSLFQEIHVPSIVESAQAQKMDKKSEKNSQEIRDGKDDGQLLESDSPKKTRGILPSSTSGNSTLPLHLNTSMRDVDELLQNTIFELNKHEDDLIADPSYDPALENPSKHLVIEDPDKLMQEMREAGVSIGPSGSAQVMNNNVRKQRKAAQVARMKIYLRYHKPDSSPPLPSTSSRKKKKHKLFDVPFSQMNLESHEDLNNSSTIVHQDKSDYNDVNKILPPKPKKVKKKKSKGEKPKLETSKKEKKRVADARFWAQFEATFNGQTSLPTQSHTGQLHTAIPISNDNNAFSLNSRSAPVLSSTSTTTTNNITNIQAPLLYYPPNLNMNLSNSNQFGFPITSFGTIDHTALPSNIPTMQNTNSIMVASSRNNSDKPRLSYPPMPVPTSQAITKTEHQSQSNNLFNNPPHQPQLPPPRTSIGLPYNSNSLGGIPQSTSPNIGHSSSAAYLGNRSMTFGFPPPSASLNTNSNHHHNNNIATSNDNNNNNYTNTNGERCIIQ